MNVWVCVNFNDSNLSLMRLFLKIKSPTDNRKNLFYNSNLIAWFAWSDFFHVFLQQSRNFNWLIVRRRSMNEMHIWLFLFFICFGIYRSRIACLWLCWFVTFFKKTLVLRHDKNARLLLIVTFGATLSLLWSSSSLFLDKVHSGPYTTFIIASSF